MKKHMKRILAALMAAAMMIMATACAGDNAGSSDAGNDKPESSDAGSSDAGDDSSSDEGDSNFNATGWPVVNESVTLKVYGSRDSRSLEDWNDYVITQRWVEDTNVKFEFELVESGTYNDKKPIKLGSGDLPDVIKNGLSVSEIVRYSNDGLLVDLTELQEKYAPFLMEAFESEYGQLVAMKACSTMPDGKRYTFPNTGLAPWIGMNRLIAINTDWLEAVGMDLPTNLNEFKDALVAFKNEDPNGNGEADEIPLSWQGALMGTNGAWDFGLNWLADSFQCPSPQNLLNVKDGKVYFVGVSEEYKNFINWMHELSAEGLLDEQGFSQTGEQYSAKKTADPPILGAASVWELGDDFATNEAYNHYSYMDPLDGLDGSPATPYTTVYDVGCGYWGVTSACTMPEVAVRVCDWWYEDPARGLEEIEGLFGEEVSEEDQVRQVPCTVCNNGVAYMVGDPPEGVNTQTLRFKCCPAGYPFYIPTEAYETYQHLHYTDLKAEKIRQNKANPNADIETIPNLTYTDEELEVVNQVRASVITESNRITAEWVLNGKCNEEWDNYVQQMNNMRLPELLDAVQAAYDRFLAAK